MWNVAVSEFDILVIIMQPYSSGSQKIEVDQQYLMVDLVQLL